MDDCFRLPFFFTLTLIDAAFGGYSFLCELQESNYYECILKGANDDLDYADTIMDFLEKRSERSKVERMIAKESVMPLMPVGIMAVLPSLKFLYLRQVKLEQINKCLTGCQRLEELDLSYNKLKSLSNVFDECNKLTVIYLEYNEISSIESDVFNNLSELKFVWLHGNFIKLINEDMFKESSKMRSVSLRDNQIQKLPQNVFKNLTNLKDLYLSNNPYEPPNEISSLVSGLKKLLTLRLAASNIFEIKLYDFEGLDLLEVLQLNHNFISHLRSECLDPLVNLQQLILNNNKIAFIESGSFLKVSNSEILSKWYLKSDIQTKMTVSGNGDKNLQNLTNLLVVRLENNNLFNITNKTFKNLKVLQKLFLPFNQIQTIHENAFESLISLDTLDLSHNMLTTATLSRKQFEHLFSLTELNLSHNKLSIVPNIFRTLISLKKLSVESNYIINLNQPISFPNLLKTVDFSYNKIDSISPIFFETDNDIKKVFMKGNICVQESFEIVNVFTFLKQCFENFVVKNLCTFKNSKFGYSCEIMSDHYINKAIIESERNHLEGKHDGIIQYIYIKNQPIALGLNKIFEKFNNVEKVEMWQASIKTLDSMFFCSKLRTFDLRLNQLAKLDSKVFSRCNNIEKLIFNKNGIVNIDEKTFEGLENMKFLDLSFNGISAFPSQTFLNTKKLATLKLSHNIMNSYSLLWLLNFSSLEILDLSHNELIYMSFGVLEKHASLQELHLNSNKLIDITSTTNKILPRLNYLNLSNNKLTCLDLIHLENVQYLDISENDIESINFSPKGKNLLGDFHAKGNRCIDESFVVINSFCFSVEPQLKSCKKVCTNLRKNVFLRLMKIEL